MHVFTTTGIYFMCLNLYEFGAQSSLLTLHYPVHYIKYFLQMGGDNVVSGPHIEVWTDPCIEPPVSTSFHEYGTLKRALTFYRKI